jgi:hypothetical protein
MGHDGWHSDQENWWYGLRSCGMLVLMLPLVILARMVLVGLVALIASLLSCD